MSTASPRDIIAAYFGGACADRTLSALTAAGYRVVLEGELEGRMSDETAKLLSEGLELCVRARKMDAMDRRATALGASKDPEGWQHSGEFDNYVARHNIRRPDQPIHTRSATVHLWVQDQYEKDLADWERRARAHLLSHPQQRGEEP